MSPELVEGSKDEPVEGSGKGCAQGQTRLFSAASEGAALAQPVEHIIRNDGVACSSHAGGTST